MRIAYVCYRDPFSRDGVVKKINTQASLWRAAGHEVIVFCLSPFEANGRQQELDAVVFPARGLRRRFATTRRLFQQVLAYEPDLVYLRHDLYLPPPVTLVRRLTTAVEVNSDDIAEWRSRSRSKALYVRPSRYLTFRNAAGFACVTHELARARAIARYARPTIVIGNGAAAEQTHTLPPPANEKPRLVFVGNPDHPWHGVDKILWLAAALPDHEFDVVGYEAVGTTPVPPNVTFHGFLPQTGYEPILARADVGVGTLALHRNRMHEASPLKVREYLLYGLPTITAYDDTDFLDQDPWYVLRLPNTEDNVRTSVDEIAAFVARVRGRRVPREDVVERLSSEAKERVRLDFLERLVEPTPHALPIPDRNAV